MTMQPLLQTNNFHNCHPNGNIQLSLIYKDLLQQVIRKYKNPPIDIAKPLSVSFMAEPGLDGGGLTREYFHMLMQRLHEQCGTFDLLEGRNGNLLPIHNYGILSRSAGLFLLLGKMILHAIINKCAGLPGLSPASIAYLVSGSRDAAIEKLTSAILS